VFFSRGGDSRGSYLGLLSCLGCWGCCCTYFLLVNVVSGLHSGSISVVVLRGRVGGCFGWTIVLVRSFTFGVIFGTRVRMLSQRLLDGVYYGIVGGARWYCELLSSTLPAFSAWEFLPVVVVREQGPTTSAFCTRWVRAFSKTLCYFLFVRSFAYLGLGLGWVVRIGEGWSGRFITRRPDIFLCYALLLVHIVDETRLVYREDGCISLISLLAIQIPHTPPRSKIGIDPVLAV
jgi:hypothetical protein